ncbi:orotate phosphoribosyltransferase [Alkanindiges illinoisensis]|uniref:orotate phosphoribosyltransferase n=1 Tax=Alkanindiges illinoisensis TaxID=197183 RepID=UPI000479975E|nr:orotate phosphoribosyltransferase [Alkanindiges illinoisensis]
MSSVQPFSPQALIELALKRGVLKFGEFTLKSGRISPYFFNAGLLNDGEALSLLASGYADKLMNCESVSVIFGPAYKGIPFVAATASALWQQHGVNVPWGFNRKEAKDHGEGGMLVGADVKGQRVWIIDDVITAGTAIREVVDILQAAGATIAGVLVALDRQEKGQGELSAIQEVEKQLNIPVHALITMQDLMDYLKKNNRSDDLAKMQDYREKYGV